MCLRLYQNLRISTLHHESKQDEFLQNFLKLSFDCFCFVVWFEVVLQTFYLSVAPFLSISPWKTPYPFPPPMSQSLLIIAFFSPWTEPSPPSNSTAETVLSGPARDKGRRPILSLVDMDYCGSLHNGRHPHSLLFLLLHLQDQEWRSNLCLISLGLYNWNPKSRFFNL